MKIIILSGLTVATVSSVIAGSIALVFLSVVGIAVTGKLILEEG